MALRFFKKQVPEVLSSYGSLSSSISPAAIKDANTAVKQCADLSSQAAASQEERTPSLPLKTKQPLPSTPSCMEGVLAMAYLANLVNLTNAPCVQHSTLHLSNGVWL